MQAAKPALLSEAREVRLLRGESLSQTIKETHTAGWRRRKSLKTILDTSLRAQSRFCMFLCEGHLGGGNGPVGKVLATQARGLESNLQSSRYRAGCGASIVLAGGKQILGLAGYQA